MTLRTAELCAGYGGLSESVRAVIEADVAWYAEYDPTDVKQHSAKILAHHLPEVPNHGDITRTDWGSVERVDILLGGYPCQPMSSAGLQAGQDDARWLWPHVARAVRALCPPLVFFENVRNHLRIGFDVVLGDLDEMGYDAFWMTLKASAVGAPHHRDRLFILGIMRGADVHALGLVAGVVQPAGAPLAVRQDGSWLDAYESLLGPVPFRGDLPSAGVVRDGVMAELTMPAVGGVGCGEVLPTPRTSDSNGAGGHGTGGPDLRTVVSELLPTPTVADSRDSRNKTAGRKPGSKHHDGVAQRGAVVMLRAGQETTANAEGPMASPGRAESAATTPRARDWKNGGKDGLEESLAASRRSPAALGATPRATDGTKGGPNQRGSSGDLMLPSVAAALAQDDFDWSQTPYAPAIRRWELILGRTAPAPVNEKGRLNPRFVEWMQGLPGGHVTDVPGLTRNAVLKGLGNGVVPLQGATAFRVLLAAAGLAVRSLEAVTA